MDNRTRATPSSRLAFGPHHSLLDTSLSHSPSTSKMSEYTTFLGHLQVGARSNASTDRDGNRARIGLQSTAQMTATQSVDGDTFEGEWKVCVGKGGRGGCARR